MKSEILIRVMQPADLPAVHALQCVVYPQTYHEPLDALESRQDSGPDLCFVAEDEGRLVAYLLAHPWSGELPPLHRALHAPAWVDHVFLHDLAVHPAFQSLSLGFSLYARLCAVAMRIGFSELRLVALGRAVQFWEKRGFIASDTAVLPEAYGEAMAMTCTLPA